MDQDVGPPPRVVVIVATYRRPHVLRLALKSAIAQTFVDWEAIVVGDACRDETEAVVASLGDPRITFIDLAVNMGEQSGPNNVGLARSRSPLVAFLNHDDLWFPDHLAVAVDTLDARRADLVFSPNLTVHVTDCSEFGPERAQFVGVTIDSLSYRGRYDPCQTDRATPASTWLATRSMLESLGGWRSAHDCIAEPSQDLLFRAHRRGYALVSTGVATAITIASGTRAGSYVSPSVAEHEWFAARLGDVGFRAQLLSCDHAINSRPPADRVDRALVWARRRGMQALASIGVSPRAAVYRTRRGLRAGEQIRRFRSIRGLPNDSFSNAGGSAESIRREEVLRVCAVEPNSVIDFSQSGTGHRHIASGWSRPEPWGVWNDGSRAELAFRVPTPGGFVFSACLHPHLGHGHNAQRVTVKVNGDHAATWQLSDEGATVVELPVSASATQTVVIELTFADSWTPSSNDPRELAIGLHWARLVPV